MMWRNILSCALVVALSGCASPATVPAGTEGDDNPMSAWGQITVIGAFPYEAQDTFTGTFGFQDSEDVAQPLRDAGIETDNYHSYPLEQLLPVGVPAQVQIVMEGTGVGDLDLWIDGDMTVWDWRCECPIGPNNEYNLKLQADEPLVLMVRHDEHGQDPELDYQIDITVQSHPFLFLPTMPVALDLNVGDGLGVDGATGPVLVFDPADQEVAVLSDDAGFTVTQAGQHVVIGAGSGSPYRLFTNSTDLDYRLLKPVTEQLVFPVGGALAEHTVTAPPGVISAGYCAFGGDLSIDPAATFTGPQGVVDEESAPGQYPLDSWGTCFETPTAEPGLLPGDYTVRFERSQGEGGDVMVWATSYER